MIWILWLQLTTIAVCPAGMPCPQPSYQKQELSSHPTQAACEAMRETMRATFERRSEAQADGMHFTSTGKVWCAAEQGGSR